MNSNDGASPRAMEDLIQELNERKSQALEMGGAEAVAKHQATGRLTVRERVDLLVDPGTWFEVGMFALPEIRRDRPVPGDGVVTGFAEMQGRPVGVIGIDATVLAGSTAPVSMRKQGRIAAFASEKGIPLVTLCDADGGRIPDVMGWRFSGLPLDFSSFLQPPEGSPEIPRAAAVLGPSYGDSALHASTAHFVVMTENAAVALSGPSVVQSAIGEEITDQELGGPDRALAIGTAHMAVGSEQDAFLAIAAFLSYLPSNSNLPAPRFESRLPKSSAMDIAGIVPTNPRSAYDMFDVIESIVDGDSVFPWAQAHGPALITAFARIDGYPIGIVANQPTVNAGALDPAALRKSSHFAEMCETFNLPLVFLQDVPGLLIGKKAEQEGIVRGYEDLVARLARSRVPKVSVVIRKAYGGGHYAMGGKPTRPDFLVAWPSAELGFMAPETGINTVYRRRLEAAFAEGGEELEEAVRAELMSEWQDESRPWEAAAHFYLDDIIDPGTTRDWMIRAIELSWGPGERVV